MLIDLKTFGLHKEGIDELNTVFHFEHMNPIVLFEWIPRKFKLRRLKKPLSKWQYGLQGKAWNTLFLENHDQPRSVNRYGKLENRVEVAKMLATYIFSQRGIPFIYQGQEIGMTNAHYTKIEQYKDVETLNMYKTLRKFLSEKRAMRLVQKASRDNSRTPMQWNRGKNAGFSTGEPWLEVNPNYLEINVEDSLGDENSILNYYKKLLSLRKKHSIFVYGDYREHYPRSNKLAYYERNYKGKKLLVICNFTAKELEFDPIYNLSRFKLILNNYSQDKKQLMPYQAKIYLGDF